MRENEKISVKTCGKLYVGGEYAVLFEGQSAIIKNINIFMYGEIFFSSEYKIKSDMFDYSVSLEYDKNYSLIQETIIAMNEYLLKKGREIQPFHLEITGKMEKNGKKYGIGSSGSVVVLIVKAIDKLYNLNLTKDMIFRFATYVLLKRGDNGSMGDIACISYENLILFRGFDKNKIREDIKKMDMLDILNENWGYKIEEINCNIDCEFLVAWTKEPSISSEMIKKVKGNIDKNFLEKTEKNVLELKKAFENGEKNQIIENIKNIGSLLYKLDKDIYNEKIKNIVESQINLEIIAKSSGAGGGDCGIAISFNENHTKTIEKRWSERDIEVLYKEKMRSNN